MNAAWFMPFLNPWLASALLRADHLLLPRRIAYMPHPLPTRDQLAQLPCWAVGGGLVGAVQVYAGLTLVNKVGTGRFTGLTVTAALIASLLIDHLSWFRMLPHPLNAARIVGGLLPVGGIAQDFDSRHHVCGQFLTLIAANEEYLAQ